MNEQVATTEIIEQIPADHLNNLLAEGNITLIDVRSPNGIDSQGSFPKAVNIPFETIDIALDPSNAGCHPIFKEKGPFLFCCTGGVMSYMAALKAQENGIERVYNLEGGHAAWLKLQQQN